MADRDTLLVIDAAAGDSPSLLSRAEQSGIRFSLLSDPDEALALILGQDALNGLDRWHDWRRLPELAHLVVMTRPGELPSYGDQLAGELQHRMVSDPEALRRQSAGSVLPLVVTPRPISSTLIRANIHDPVALRQLVPDAVAALIERDGLYSGSPSAERR